MVRLISLVCHFLQTSSSLRWKFWCNFGILSKHNELFREGQSLAQMHMTTPHQVKQRSPKPQGPAQQSNLSAKTCAANGWLRHPCRMKVPDVWPFRPGVHVQCHRQDTLLPTKTTKPRGSQMGSPCNLLGVQTAVCVAMVEQVQTTSYTFRQ